MKLRTHRIPGLVLTDHTFSVPLDHARPDGDTLDVFAREVSAADKAEANLPWLVFFQGGPGFPSPRPAANAGWLKRALREYRVLLLDQRGTGLSTPVTAQTLQRFDTPAAMAGYLQHFRADAIVNDAELIRRQMLGEHTRWSALGQSYGGFCITHYLSVAPGSLTEAIITGGLPPLTRPVDDVYRATYRRVIAKNRQHYERYPGDAELAREIAQALTREDVRLPNGDRLSARRFQQLGLQLGASDGFEAVHYLLEQAFVNGPHGRAPSLAFLRGMENADPFDVNPIYAILHEAIYCQGEASRWSAERIRGEYPELALADDRPVFFTGEMIYPWMFEEHGALAPMREAAHILADHDGWPRLYDPEVLAQNTVPVVAAIYYDDMYVERAYSEETAAAIKGLRFWVTNEYEHNGLRASAAVLDRLLGMLHGEV